MTLNNLIKQSELPSSKADRDALIMEVFGLSQQDLYFIRSERRVIDRVILGAEVLSKRLIEEEIDPTIIPAQLTVGNLALLIDDGSYSTSPVDPDIVSTALGRKYRERKAEAEEETGLSPTYTQLLREDLGLYEGNLYGAKGMWPGLEVSEYDWLKDVRIPIEIGTEEAILLGIFYADGTILSKRDRRDAKIEFFGRHYDFEFYEKMAMPLVKMVHNIIPCTPSDKRFREWVERDEDRIAYNLPSFEIDSLAFVSWLQTGFGMSIHKEDREIPEFETDEQKLGFLKGIVAADAGLYIYPNRSRMRLRGGSLYIEGLERLSRDLGFSPRADNGKFLDYGKQDITDMVSRGMFLNPYHIRQLKPSMESN